jgi:hypothetical protein
MRSKAGYLDSVKTKNYFETLYSFSLPPIDATKFTAYLLLSIKFE